MCRSTDGQLPMSPTIPVLRIVEIALQQVHDAVCPARERARLVLHDHVCGLPIAPLEVLHRVRDRLGGHDSSLRSLALYDGTAAMRARTAASVGRGATAP